MKKCFKNCKNISTDDEVMSKIKEASFYGHIVYYMADQKQKAYYKKLITQRHKNYFNNMNYAIYLHYEIITSVMQS